MANRIEMSSCDLRVLVRFNDGIVGSYAIDGIPSASRLRDELSVVADIFGDPECVEDMPHESDAPPLYGRVFEEMQSALTNGWREREGGGS